MRRAVFVQGAHFYLGPVGADHLENFHQIAAGQQYPVAAFDRFQRDADGLKRKDVQRGVWSFHLTAPPSAAAHESASSSGFWAC
ncbi:MAG: hypothetical protein B7Y69_09285 [Sphingobacteriia bacterium 35-40-8]|nr:MAG: hypothetical protein B7Y69_09285 [Sphingobacteriia bacterium 35-40-8]